MNKYILVGIIILLVIAGAAFLLRKDNTYVAPEKPKKKSVEELRKEHEEQLERERLRAKEDCDKDERYRVKLELADGRVFYTEYFEPIPEIHNEYFSRHDAERGYHTSPWYINLYTSKTQAERFIENDSYTIDNVTILSEHVLLRTLEKKA